MMISMKPQFPVPEQPTLFAYIVESTLLAREEITHGEVSSTFKREALHPSAAGHFSAIKYATDLAQKNDFPARHPSQWETVAKADTNLYWLRELHKKLMTPTADYGTMFLNPNVIKRADCGPYRLTPASIVDRQMPKPNLVRPLLATWYKRVAEFHLKIGAVLRRPSNDDLLAIEDATWKAHLQLLCIRPWNDGVGRSARLVENALRLRWGLPWKTIPSRDKIKYVQQVMAYEDSDDWKQFQLASR